MPFFELQGRFRLVDYVRVSMESWTQGRSHAGGAGALTEGVMLDASCEPACAGAGLAANSSPSPSRYPKPRAYGTKPQPLRRATASCALSWFLLLFSAVAQAIAQPSGQRTIRVVMDNNYPPFVFQDSAGCNVAHCSVDFFAT